MSTSKLQRHVSELLSTHLGKYTIQENLRPDWLITEKGERLELDFYIEELNVAIEIQGRHHYEYIPYFHGGIKGFSKRLAWDRFKQDTCATKGIQLYEVSDEYDIQEILEKLVGIEYEATVHPNTIIATTGPRLRRIPKQHKRKNTDYRIIKRWLNVIKRERKGEYPRKDRIIKYQKKIAERLLRQNYSKSAIVSLLETESWQPSK